MRHEFYFKIRECLLNAIERYILQTNRSHKVYTIETGGRKISIDFDDILFFETSSNIHKVILHAKDRIISFTNEESCLISTRMMKRF